MFRNLSKTLGLMLLSAAVISSSYGGEKLRYQMVKGSTYKYVITADTKSTTQVMGQEMGTKVLSYLGILSLSRTRALTSSHSLPRSIRTCPMWSP